MSHVIVVGGGAAGMFAAIAAAKNGHQVTLYEKNEKLGKKILGYKVSSQTVDSGCNIKTGEIIYNNEFTTLLDFHREDLEKEILEKIFD